MSGVTTPATGVESQTFNHLIKTSLISGQTLAALLSKEARCLSGLALVKYEREQVLVVCATASSLLKSLFCLYAEQTCVKSQISLFSRLGLHAYFFPLRTKLILGYPSDLHFRLACMYGTDENFLRRLEDAESWLIL